jgi:hypothetical protein
MTDSNLTLVKETVCELCNEYENIRKQMPSGDERKRLMTVDNDQIPILISIGSRH